MSDAVPQHPKTLLRRLSMEQGFGQRALVDQVGLSAAYANGLWHGNRGVGPTAALALERLFPSVPALEWMTLQAAYDLEQARLREYDLQLGAKMKEHA